MHKRSKFLDRWEDYCPFGDVIEKTCILPLKVPLKESLSKRYEEKERFTPQTLIDMLNDRGLTLGLIIDLTFTTKYYNPEEFMQRGINYKKIYVAGQRIPSDEVVYQMFDIINSFQQHVNVDNKYIIGIHCTHGINRTGYMVCRYLMDVLGWQSGVAVDAFNKARHHQIYRENFVKELHRRGKLHESEMKVGPPGERFKRDGWRQDPGGFRQDGSAGFNFVHPVPNFSYKSGDSSRSHTIVPVKELTSNSKNNLKYAAGLDCPEHVVEGTIMKLMTKKENYDSPLTSVKKHCPLEVTGVIEVKGPDDKNPQYTDLVSLPEDQVVLIDSNNNRCFLLDSSFNNISSYPLSNKPRRVSLFDGNEVAVTLNNKNQIQFLTVKNNTIKPTRMIKTRLPCFGIAVAGKGSTIVTGPNFARSKCYWSVINDRGEEMSYHEYWDSALNDSYLALNASKTRVYISTWETNSLFCFDIAGRRLFVYSPDNLKGSYGITLDMDDNVYVVGKQSKNIHQLSPDGAILQILTAELPQYPAAVTYKRTKNQLLLTNRSSDNKKIHVIKLS
ncbi:hypothetical protein CHS0354_036449 [Potamilus streckersoni]|uniref:mRNA guanylyltransferase n=1 Tax=Potamilus streckersoni TaxID=2493646 RepID=A0AAE0W2V2_9BIVA|nr:hypothetical protein CHS0354_036449 [Potamilus streckersoni]